MNSYTYNESQRYKCKYHFTFKSWSQSHGYLLRVTKSRQIKTYKKVTVIEGWNPSMNHHPYDISSIVPMEPSERRPCKSRIPEANTKLCYSSYRSRLNTKLCYGRTKTYFRWASPSLSILLITECDNFHSPVDISIISHSHLPRSFIVAIFITCHHHPE